MPMTTPDDSGAPVDGVSIAVSRQRAACARPTLGGLSPTS